MSRFNERGERFHVCKHLATEGREPMSEARQTVLPRADDVFNDLHEVVRLCSACTFETVSFLMSLEAMTAERYEKLFRTSPGQDDLDRVNCTRVGEVGHWLCGVCPKHVLPRFVCGCLVRADGNIQTHEGGHDR